MNNVANDSQVRLIKREFVNMLDGSRLNMKTVADLDLTFSAIMRVVESFANSKDYQEFRKALHIARRTNTYQAAMAYGARYGKADMLRQIHDMAQTGTSNRTYPHVPAEASKGACTVYFVPRDDTDIAIEALRNKDKIQRHMVERLKTMVTIDESSTMPGYDSPNRGNRILPSGYGALTIHWVRSNGRIIDVLDMNQGHLTNTLKLLKESHGNVTAKATTLLGKMANHFANQPHIVSQLESICRDMQKVEVDEMYPVFTPIAKALQSYLTVQTLGVAEEFTPNQGELNWE